MPSNSRPGCKGRPRKFGDKEVCIAKADEAAPFGVRLAAEGRPLLHLHVRKPLHGARPMTHPQAQAKPTGTLPDRDFDAVIVGAGFAGLYMLHRLRGMGLTARVLEAGSGVGGTWYWNRYPGARCDVESVQYSFQFSDALQQEWDWSERYAAQPELLAYANHVADRFDLRRDIQFNTRVSLGAPSTRPRGAG